MVRLLVLASTIVLVVAGCVGSTGRPSESDDLHTPPASVAASAMPQPSASPEPTPSQSEAPDEDPVFTPRPTKPPFPGNPVLIVGSRRPTEPAQIGGCATVFYRSEAVVGDLCGAFGFDAIIDEVPIAVSSGEAITIRSPATYMFAATELPRGTVWSIVVAPASKLRGRRDERATGIPLEIGRVLAGGVGPNGEANIQAPSKPGEYVLQLDAPLMRDGWTFDGNLYFWLIRVR